MISWSPLRRLTLVFLLGAMLAACGGPPSSGGPSEGGFAPGAPFVADDGATVATSDEDADPDITFSSEVREAPQVPLPDGVERVGPFRRITADGYATASPREPFLLGLPVPEGVEPENLAIGYLDRGRVEIAPGEGEGATEGTITWMFLDAFYDAETDLLFAPVLNVTPEGWEAAVVRSPRFETRTTSSAEEVEPQQADPAFEATCSPLFDADGAAETCGQAERDDAADALEQVFDDLTGLGFTDEPKLTLRPGDVIVTVTSFFPLRYTVTVVPDTWVMELRPSSQVSNAGMYSSGSGSFWAAIGTGGVTAGTRNTIRHEYFHATQYGYDPDLSDGWLRSRFSIEGQAVLSENSIPNLSRDGGFGPRDIDDTLLRSRWNGSSWRAAPFSEYQAQDFWMFLGQEAGSDLSFVVPFAEEGMAPEDVDAVLERDWSSTYPDGLEDAYWDWVKNQVFESRHDLGGALSNECTFDGNRVSTVALSASDGGSDQTTLTLTEVTSEVVEFELTNTASISAGFDLSTSFTSADQEVKFYDPADAGSDACWDDLELPSASVLVPAGETITRYALVANVGLGPDVDVTASIEPGQVLGIVLPDQPYRVGDAIEFRADLSGLTDPSSVTIEWSATDAEDQDVPLPFTTTSGQTETYADVPCTDLLIRAEATLPNGDTVFDVEPVSCEPPVETFVYDVDRSMSGMVTSDGRVLDGDDIQDILVGDDADDNGLHGLLHFDLPTLPEDLEAIESATLVLGFEDPVGTPFSDLGELNVVHVDYGTSMEASNYREAPSDTQLLPGLTSTMDTDFGTTEIDVTTHVRDAWDNRDQRGRKVQFMPYTSISATDNDGTPDHYIVNFEDRPATTLIPSLEIEFRNYTP